MDVLAAWMGQPEVTGSAPTEFDRMIFSYTDYGPLGNTMESGCAATICAMLAQTGYKSTRSAAAISYKKYGTPCELKPGAICVFEWSPGEHHVSTCLKVIDQKTAVFRGGNQSHLVKDSVYETRYLIGIRWPVKA